jgi:hypothetical protein
MDLFIGVIAAVIGYLIGSVSFTRIVLAIRAPDTKVENIQESIPGSDKTFT